MSNSGADSDFQLYRYTPSIAAAIIFITSFALTTLYHGYQLIKSRSWYLVAFAVGGLCKCFTASFLTSLMMGLEGTMLTIAALQFK